MFSIVINFACNVSRSFNASFVKSSVIALPVKREFAMTRFNAPSELAHVGSDALRDEERHFFGKHHVRGLGFADENRNAGLELRRFDGDGESPSEAGFQAFFEA